jgi:succinyl-CoA synthetase beta subunit
MNIHEYQAKKILAKFKVPVPQGQEAFSVDEICKAGADLAADTLVLKAQIHAGGRGKGGGIKVVKNLTQLKEEATKMLGMTLITPQTGAQGKVVKRLYVEKASDIAKEYYLGMVVDRKSSCVSFIASTEGGMEIEEVAHKHPEKIITINIDPAMGMQAFHARKIAYALGFDGEKVKKFVSFATNLYEAFVVNDASQVEINPLVLTTQGEFVALDAKFNFDDNALFRHPEIMALRDEEEEEPLEKRALEAGLSYVKMEGDIGCMVNGAGLAMATMDIIKLYGKEPANFLDVGGGATKEKVTEAFKIIVSDKNVKGILVNIFGGIMKCDIIAQGIIAAAKEISLNVPLVVRLAGTNFSEGKALLDNSGLKLISADDLSDAADKIVKAI